MPYDEFLPDDMPEFPTHFTVAPPPMEHRIPTNDPPKHGFRPPRTPGLCRLSGRVRSRRGLPVSDATVSLCTASLPREVIASVRTDNRGAFHFSRLRPGRYVLKAHSRHRRGEEPIRLSHKHCNLKDVTVTLR